MALQKTNVSLSFKQGLDTKTDPKQVVFGKLLNLQNGKFISPTQIKKRNGYQARCKECNSIYQKNHYNNNKSSSFISTFLCFFLLSEGCVDGCFNGFSRF